MSKALLVIDVQNDFTPPHGALAVPDGDEVIPRINELAGSDEYDLVLATRDWHPPDHGSFREHGGSWPRHCVQGTEGAELDPGLDLDQVDLVLDKGHDRDLEGYSAFERGDLDELLRERDIDEVTVVGLATDVCVRATALDAVEAGYRTEVDPSATRGVDAEDSQRSLLEVKRAGGRVRGLAD